MFARELDEPLQVVRAVLATLLFCLLSGAVYLVNDLLDVEKDRLHPVKRSRPLACGQLTPPPRDHCRRGHAQRVSRGRLGSITPFAAVAAGYLTLQAIYVTVHKHAVLPDGLALAGGVVLRALPGAVLLDVPIPPWLYDCTMHLALFLPDDERRQELIFLHAGAANHRPALDHYTIGLVDSLLQVVTTSLLVAYMLYTFFAENLPRNSSMMLTIPFVLYGLFRYLYLIHARGEGGSPEEVLLRDRAMAACVILWALTSAAILYFIPRG